MPIPSTPAFRTRKGVRLQVANEEKRVQGMLDGTVLADLRVLRHAETKLVSYIERLYRLDEQIQNELETAQVPADDCDEEAAQTAGYNSELAEFSLAVKDKIEDIVVAQTPPPSPAVSGNVSMSSQSAHMNVRLPQLDAPKFSGDYLEFPTFWDLFHASIHDNAGLSNSEKFAYLLKGLSGDALNVVKGLQVTNDNYTHALDLLKERYGDTERAKMGHFQQMLAIPAATHSRTLSELRRVYDAWENHIRSLISLGVPEDTFTIVYAPLILSKLPEDVIDLLSQKNGRQAWSLNNIREWVKDEIWARELKETLVSGSRNANEQKPKHWQGKPTENRGSASMLVSNARGKPRKNCGYCDQEHFSDECKKFPDMTTRKAFLFKAQRCFRCLGEGHPARNCRGGKVTYAYCRVGDHHRSLCPTKFGQAEASSSSFSRGGSGSRSSQLNAVVHSEDVSPVNSAVAVAQRQEAHEKIVSFLPTALAELHDDSGSSKMQGRVLMDTASSRSYVTEDVCKKLGLKVLGESYVSVGRFGSNKRITSKTKRVQLAIECSDGTKIRVVASVTPVISSPVHRVSIDPNRFPVMNQLKLAEPLNPDLKVLPIDVLIGSDFYYEFVTPDAVITCKDGPTLVGSRLGFLTAGTMPIPENEEPENALTVLLLTEAAPGKCDPFDQFDLERFWRMEEVGTKGKKDPEISDERAMENFYKTLKFVNGRYEVTWPYKVENPDLPDNRGLALARLKSTYGRLRKNPELLETYNEIIQKQLDGGVVEVAPVKPTGLVYYVPHHEVVTPSKSTTKVRVVYDASSKTRKDGVSLNDCLHRGKVILEDLCGLLIRFRKRAIGIVADIEKAFLQIGLQESERDVGRFFWVRDIARPLTSDNLVTYRFTRVFFGAIASPSLLGLTLDAHARSVEKSSPDPVLREMAKRFREDIYSDNHISGEQDEKQAVKHYQETKRLCQQASMNLREFYSNSKVLREKMDPKDCGQASVTKVLGVTWDLNADTLRCCGLKQPVRVDRQVATKRSIVREVAQIFDPCGWFTPVTLLGKLLVQEVWQLGLSWDEEVPEELNERWEGVRSTLALIPTKEIPRYIGNPGAEHELHVFCDASQKAAAAVVYGRTNGQGTIDVNLVCAKSRLAPLNPKQTIPRLELVAVDLGVRLLEFVAEHLRVDVARKYVWSDSQCVLAWLKNARLTTKFVRARVEAIRLAKGLTFRFVAGTENPADVPSRGCTTAGLLENGTWWKGPTWLRLSDDRWPVSGLEDEPDGELALVVPECVSPIDVSRFSSLTKLLRTTAWVLRAIAPKNRRKKGSELLMSELASARKCLEKLAQNEAFLDLRSGKVTAQAVKKAQLGPLHVFKDEQGLLRCHSRLENSELPFETQKPIILPKDHALTKLVIRQAHEDSLHAGVTQTLVEIRKRYWIVHGRSQVKKALLECRKCRRVEGGAYAVPPAPALPAIRVTTKSPFAYTGLDYLGPLVVRVEGSVGKTQKVWVSLFTCALTRAVHLEVVENQSAEEFHLALRRFVAIYGTPLVIVSDNASQFRAVELAIEKLQKAGTSSAHMGIEWRKITESAPWMGGFYERMVGTVKRFLKKALDGVLATISELRTVVAEITNIVNSRPLLYVEDDTTSYSLSPNDFLGRYNRPGFPVLDNGQRCQNPHSTIGRLVQNWNRLQSMSVNS